MKKLALSIALLLSSCTAQQRAVLVPTVEEIAKSLCMSAGAKTGLSVQDVEKAFCFTEKQLEPWISAAKDAQVAGIAQSGMNEK